MREGSDALVVTTGITLKPALDAALELGKEGIETAVVHVPTIKPLDRDTLLEYAGRVPVVVTVEEHSVIGGLGSAVAELIAEADFSAPKRFRRIGIPDVFPDQYGSQASLMDRYEINSKRICSLVRELVGCKPVLSVR